MTLMHFISIGFVLAFIGHEHFALPQDLYAGSVCTLPDGSSAICTPLPQCRTIADKLERRIISYQSVRILRCSFEGSTEVICCSDVRPQTVLSEKPGCDIDENDDICFNITPNKPVLKLDTTTTSTTTTTTRRTTTRPTTTTRATTTTRPTTTRPTTKRPTSTTPSSSKNGGVLIKNTNPEYLSMFGKTEDDLDSDNGQTDELTTPVPRVGNQRKCEAACSRYITFRKPPISFHILEGVPAESGEFPHMAALGYNTENGVQWNCGGTLISERYVLTAAHCGSSRTPKPVVVRIGVVDLNDSNQDGGVIIDYDVEEMILHPQYGSNQNYNDIAIIRLVQTVQFNLYMHPACLRVDVTDPDDMLWVTGWGRINAKTDQTSLVLLKTNLTIVSVDVCNASYISQKRRLPRGLDEGHMCADGVGDACQGDSGGPLQIIVKPSYMNYIVGVTSFGYSCGSGIPGVYARVANYIDWIESIVWP